MDFGDILLILFLVFMVAILAIGVVSCVQDVHYQDSKTEVETYTVGCEVTQIAYAEEAISRSSSRPVYKMGVRCDDFSATLDITSEQFAMFTIGDIVEVKVIVYEYEDGKQVNEYELMGIQK